MDKWWGSIEDLQALVKQAGVDGTWEQKGNQWCFRGSRKQVLNWWPSTNKVTIQGQDPETFRAALEAAQGGEIQTAAAVPPKAKSDARIFVVHGHDSVAREQLELVLMKLGLTPFILMNQSGGGKTIIEALEHQIYENSVFGIVLMTPDDYGYPKDKADADRQPRARQNVILEAGMIMAALGRSRMAILKKGALEVPSDLDGFLRLEFNSHVKEVVNKLAQSMIDAGIPVDYSKVSYAAS